MTQGEVDVFIVVAPTADLAQGVSTLLSSNTASAIPIEPISSSVTLDECSWRVKTTEDDLVRLLPTSPFNSHHIAELEKELKAARDRYSAMQLDFEQFQQDVHELQTHYIKVCESNQRLLWEYLPQHDPTITNIPTISHSIEENVHVIGNYTIQAVIGEGQYASVYACITRARSSHEPCRITAPSAPLAVKVIDKSKLVDVLALQRIQMELTALQDPLLRHPSLLFLREVIHTPKYIYLVTDCGGKDLFEYFGPHENGISEATTIQVMFKIVDAIHHLHTHGYCHRDLKPENILYTPETSSVKVVDFGLCMKLDRRHGSSKTLSDFCGSPGFFAPEILLQETYDGFKADVWSLGCILLELVLGNAFFLSIWMSAYQLEVLGDRALFRHMMQQNLENVVKALDNPSMHLYSKNIKMLLIKMLVESAKDRMSITEVYEHATFDAHRRKRVVHKSSTEKSYQESSNRGHVHIHPMSNPPSPPRPKSEEHGTGKLILPAIGKQSPEKPR
ncbi:kinase [Thraustotheca clavata]|uniref:Kinase n=1 Tax=Thraustotheca clavata TaxID=74557 RepID=A0A1W0A2D7_9STRA|nr:kinase [Thraustotheca clavata]